MLIIPIYAKVSNRHYGELAKLRGLGKKSEQQLNKIGIYTQISLQKIGSIAVYIKLGKPHLCFFVCASRYT
ncbi:TfoX/Sxy family DNA transformation protein [Candidatus Thiodubiliella endoseptemdiera]|uniref:TfoX/Sxy family DNA transformation protein n=1 Tax=Candidatus Thiodubiliella endoseptemdiera TaxID=2738886 RepID=UPI0034DE6CFB